MSQPSTPFSSGTKRKAEGDEPQENSGAPFSQARGSAGLLPPAASGVAQGNNNAEAGRASTNETPLLDDYDRALAEKREYNRKCSARSRKKTKDRIADLLALIDQQSKRSQELEQGNAQLVEHVRALTTEHQQLEQVIKAILLLNQGIPNTTAPQPTVNLYKLLEANKNKQALDEVLHARTMSLLQSGSGFPPSVHFSNAPRVIGLGGTSAAPVYVSDSRQLMAVGPALPASAPTASAAPAQEQTGTLELLTQLMSESQRGQSQGRFSH